LKGGKDLMYHAKHIDGKASKRLVGQAILMTLAMSIAVFADSPGIWQGCGDLNGDGVVNMLDHAAIASAWRHGGCESPNWCGGADLDRSGDVNASDILLIAENWLMGVSSGNIVLGRPTANSITASLLSDDTIEAYLEYGIQPGIYTGQTAANTIAAGVPYNVVVQNLQPDTQYYYRLCLRQPGKTLFAQRPEYTFHTQRSPGAPFTFDIQADSHLYDHKCSTDLYRIALQNELADSPDFLVDLGDTFGDDHDLSITRAEMLQLHLDQRPFLGLIGRSAPVFLCIGNHEAECGAYMNGTPDTPAVYATLARQYYYANPIPDSFYTGNSIVEPFVGLPQNYYAWTWGDALFVVLDAYRYVTVSPKPTDLWDWTIGKDQYDWFKRTLEQSNARFKFVFAHHVMGQTRGAAVYTGMYEWGGSDRNGTWMFNAKRPGWAMPIHQLMVQNGVTIYFQGHDHLFARETVDGVVYQEVPMPSDGTYHVGDINAGGYIGDTLNNSGHLRVMVSSSQVKVDYVRAWLPQDCNQTNFNGQVSYTYTVPATR
jgi:hypothetical protein